MNLDETAIAEKVSEWDCSAFWVSLCDRAIPLSSYALPYTMSHFVTYPLGDYVCLEIEIGTLTSYLGSLSIVRIAL
jgi:hypothetical protein